MIDIIIIGGGGHGCSVIEVLSSHSDYNPVGYVDECITEPMASLNVDYLGCDDDLVVLLKKISSVVIGVGQIKSPLPRITLGTKLLELEAKLPAIVSSYALKSSYSDINDGSVVFHRAFINADSSVGKFNIINSGAIVEHGVVTEDYVHIAPSATLLGDVKIGYGSFIGAGSIIREGVTIGSHCIVGAGVVVSNDISDKSLITSGR